MEIMEFEVSDFYDIFYTTLDLYAVFPRHNDSKRVEAARILSIADLISENDANTRYDSWINVF